MLVKERNRETYLRLMVFGGKGTEKAARGLLQILMPLVFGVLSLTGRLGRCQYSSSLKKKSSLVG